MSAEAKNVARCPEHDKFQAADVEEVKVVDSRYG